MDIPAWRNTLAPLSPLSMYFLIGTKTLPLILWILAWFKAAPLPRTNTHAHAHTHTHTPSSPFPECSADKSSQSGISSQHKHVFQSSRDSGASSPSHQTWEKQLSQTLLPLPVTVLLSFSDWPSSYFSFTLSPLLPLGFPESGLLQRVDYSSKPRLIKTGQDRQVPLPV